MIPQIKEINLPSYATLNKATVTFNDMGEKTITSQVSIDGQITPDFSFDWELEFKGEKYIMPLRTPQASKDYTSWSSKIDLTFQHWAIYQLKRWYFFTLQSVEAGVAVADQYIASVSLNLKNFCDLYGQMLKHYFDDKITIDLNPDWQYAEEPIYIDINYSYLWDVLIKLYELFAVRWEIVSKGDTNHYVIKVGYPVEEMNHIFEYGFEGGLLKVERQVQDDNIRNMLLGRGGDKNIPYRYFKNTDPQNPTFPQDPDWIPELANVYFDRLRSAEFRSYVQGWKAKHYQSVETRPKNPGRFVTINETLVPWAYWKGYNDEKFDPVEYVADKIAQNPFVENTKEVKISPTYTAPVFIGSSIDKYGPLLGALDDNDEYYPSIQGVVIDPLGRIDQVIDVEQVTTDALDEEKQNEVDTWNESVPPYTSTTTLRQKFNTITIKIPNYKLKVPKGYTASILNYKVDKSLFVGKLFGSDVGDRSNDLLVTSDNAIAFNSIGQEVGAAGLTEGEYEIGFKIGLEADNIDFNNYYGNANITISNITIAYGLAIENQKNQATFDIWIKNIWQTTKGESESAETYAERVWKPILGDHLGEEAAVCFSSGLLSTSEDYTFLILGKTISKGIHYDTSKSLNGVQSHWRLTLVRSDADYDSLGKLVPNLERQGKAGDYFYFTGIELTQYYVEWAENRLHNYKLDQLEKIKDIQPSWVVSLDKVRIGTPHYDETQSLLSQLRIGGSVRIADKRFIGGSTQLYLYLQQITYKYNESQNKANLTPDTEIVLGTDYAPTANPVSTIQSQIDALHNQIGGYSISNIEQIVRAVGDRIYLRKDGITDRSQSQTYFAELLAALGFRQGMVGGYGWGMFKDENGKWVIETDRLNVREEMQVNTLVINQIQARGGMIIESAASIEVSAIEELSNAYKVYFDTKHSSLGNLFRVDDVAYCHRYTPENQDLKYYKRRVIEIGEDYITLSKTIVDGHGVPSEGDVIVHFGNYIDKERQYVIIRDVMGGGYERMLSGLNSVTAIGVEYFFAGYQSSTGERLFIGNRDGNNWLEYVNGKLTISGRLSVKSEVQNNDGTYSPLEEYLDKIIQAAIPDQKDIEAFVKGVVDPQLAEMQKQLDGVIETWFGDGEPSLDRSGYPMNQWGNSSFETHAGDLYYDNKTGYAYRFSKEGNQWKWVTITDEAITKALAAAAEAKKEAESKSRIFVTTPYTPYDEGDLWVNATWPEGADKDTAIYYDDILKCKTSRESGAFNINDWGYASSYPTDIAGYKYLKEALNQSTLIDGGLILTSLIQLGMERNSVYNVWSGINGIPLDDVNKGYGIAAWYGGDMDDIYFPDPNVTTHRFAQSLFRFDGSGYLSGGNIGWDKEGGGWLAGKNITWKPDGSLTLNSGIHIEGLGSGLDTLESIVNLLNKFTDAFKPIYKDGNGKYQETTWAKIGVNFPLAAIKSEKGFYSEEFISALGLNLEAGSGGSGGGIDASALWGLLGASTNEQIASSHLSNALSGYAKTSDVTKVLTLQRNGSQIATYNGTGAVTANISVPTNTNELTNGAGFITSSSLANYVTLNTTQTISGKKTFSGGLAITSGDENPSMPYFLGIDAFANGGTVKWIYAEKVCAAIGAATTSSLGNYLARSGGSMTTTALVSNLNAQYINGFASSALVKAGGGLASGATEEQLTGTVNSVLYVYPQASLSINGTVVTFNAASSSSYGFQLCGRLYDGGLFWRCVGSSVNGGVGNWHQLAYLTSNVASATQLLNMRTIWGQNFNGTANVSGAMTGVTTINTSASPANTIYTNNWYRSVGNTGWYSETYGGGFYMEDSVWIRTWGNKSFYHNSGTLRTDGVLQVGPSGGTFIATNGGNVGVGTTSPSYKFHVVGVIYSTTGIFSDGYVSAKGQNASSDERLKKGLSPINISLAQIANAPSVCFKWKKNGKDDFGSIAQYWQSINPLFVRKDFNDYLSLDYGKLALTSAIAIAREVINDNQRIEKLERRVKELEGMIKER